MALNVHSNVALCVWKNWNAKNNLSKRTLPDLSILRIGHHNVNGVVVEWWWYNTQHAFSSHHPRTQCV